MQQALKTARIGYLNATLPAIISARTEAFRLGLRELGYVEGKNIRYAEGKLDRLPALAAELVSLKVTVIVTGGAAAVSAVQQATKTIPIVMAISPIRSRSASSPACPIPVETSLVSVNSRPS